MLNYRRRKRWYICLDPGTGVQGRHFIFFQGGQNARLPRERQNMKKTKFCVQKHKKINIFQNQGGGANAPSAPPQMTSLLVLFDYTKCLLSRNGVMIVLRWYFSFLSCKILWILYYVLPRLMIIQIDNGIVSTEISQILLNYCCT